MNVKELIKFLETAPQDSDVRLRTSEGGLYEDLPVFSVGTSFITYPDISVFIDI